MIRIAANFYCKMGNGLSEFGSFHTSGSFTFLNLKRPIFMQFFMGDMGYLKVILFTIYFQLYVNALYMYHLSSIDGKVERDKNPKTLQVREDGWVI